MYCNATYVKHEVEISKGEYPNGRLAIVLVDPDFGECWAVATVNLPEVHLEKDEIIVKDWSENEGMLAFLVDNGLVEDTGKTAATGYATANIVKVTDKLKEICGI